MVAIEMNVLPESRDPSRIEKNGDERTDHA